MYQACRGPALHIAIVATVFLTWGAVPAGVTAYCMHTGFLFEIDFGDGTTLVRRPVGRKTRWYPVPPSDTPHPDLEKCKG
jgi:hypothetical protein